MPPAERFNTAASDSTTRKAQMHFCSDAQMPRTVKTAPAVLTDRVRSPLYFVKTKAFQPLYFVKINTFLPLFFVAHP